MRIRTEQQPSGDWDAALARKAEAVQRATWAASREGINLVVRAVKRTLRTYTHPEGEPTNSPPGQPPALVTGNLMRSVKPRGPYMGKRPFQVVSEAGPTIVYGRIQELGGVTGKGHRTHLPPRPYQRPATNRVRRNVRRIFVTRWREALRA